MRFKSQPRKGHFMPELVAASDASRPVLSTVHLNVEKSCIEVTDSYMLARFPVELDEGDTSGPIPLDALKASRKPPLKHVEGASIRCNSHVEVRHAFGEQASEPYITLPRDSSDYTFPNIDQLMPDNLSSFEVGINATKLASLAKAMGSDIVKIRFAAGGDGEPSNMRPALINPGSETNRAEEDPQGLIMLVPIR